MPLSAGAPSDAEELIHGVVVRDPYRWLEDGTSPKTRDWIAGQQHRFEGYFAQSEDLDLLRNRVREYLDAETVDQPARIANRYFYRKRSKGYEQACIYMRDASTGKERLLVDPSIRGISASVGIHRISFDGSLLAYEFKQGGTDTLAIHFVDVDSAVELPDTIESGYARGLALTADRSGFFYCQEQGEASGDHTIRFHRFGDHGSDEAIYRLPRTAGSKLSLTSDDIHLGAIAVRLRDGQRVADLAIANRNAPRDWKTVLSNFDHTYKPWLSNGRIFAIDCQTAPQGKMVELDERGREIRVVIPERSETIQHLVIVGERIVVTYLQQWGTVAESWTLSGQYVGKLDIPVDGTIRLLQAQGSEQLFCTYESISTPIVIFEFQSTTAQLALWHQHAGPAWRTACNAREIVVPSHDGAEIPMMLVTRGKPTLDGTTPVIMTGYGGFGTSVTPQYSILVSIMLELGAAFALARIRGGGEFGKNWHDAAKKGGRQNSFNDFIAIAEWLCAENVTTPKGLAIFGGSNAGLLVAAVLTQRPDLFGAVLCISPLLDMVRYEKFDQAARWRHEFGSVESADDFHALHAYSPYHRVVENIDYPPVLFVSGDKDDRCNPAHVRKMAARLQQRNSQTHPILVDYSRDRGHSPVLPLSVRVESLARRITFLRRELKVE